MDEHIQRIYQKIESIIDVLEHQASINEELYALIAQLEDEIDVSTKGMGANGLESGRKT